MTSKVTITIESAAKRILAFLHYPDESREPTKLEYNEANTIPALPAGIYDVSLSASQQVPKTPVRVTFATEEGGSLTLGRRIKDNGTIAGLPRFTLLADGTVE